MGMDCDGTHFYGLVFDRFGEDDEDRGWPERTEAVFTSFNAEDFEEWLEAYLGVEPWWVDGKEVRDLNEFKAEMKAKSIATFGVEWDQSYIGYIDYSIHAIHPKDAVVSGWRCGRVPEYSLEDIERWRVACERLAAVLPGASAPGFWYGCSVG